MLTACKQYCLAAGATQGNIAYTQNVMPHCRTTQQTDKIKNEKSYNNWGDIWNR